MSFGYVVDYRCAPKDALGGTLAAAGRIAEGATLRPTESCAACQLAAAPGAGCIGVVATPISAAAEEWLLRRLPESIEGIAGVVVKQAVATGFLGNRARPLRAAGKLGGPHPIERHWGGFFRRFTVTGDQLFEQLFCAGDVEPAHGLAILVQLGAIAVDGAAPGADASGAGLAELAGAPADRARRTQCTITETTGDEQQVAELKRYLRALYAGFCLDVPVRVFSD
jgi:hypothetical protein